MIVIFTNAVSLRIIVKVIAYALALCCLVAGTYGMLSVMLQATRQQRARVAAMTFVMMWCWLTPC